MRILSLLLALSVTVTPAIANKKPVQDCKVRFAVTYVDRLDNVNHGLTEKQVKDVQKKLANYGDVCYTADEAAADYVFFIHTKPATYHGVQTTRETHTDTNPVTGTITDESGNVSTINGTTETTTTSTSSVPYEVDYSVFILNIMARQKDAPDKFTILRTFDQKGLYNRIYGIGYGKGKHPIANVIDAAAKWLHDTDMGQKQN